jgi:VIT1/CCC1 family predicted Fe2+/Mn2+ transporter
VNLALLKDLVLGADDGLTATLVFVLSVTGLSPSHVALVALAQVLGNTISMTLGGMASADAGASRHPVLEGAVVGGSALFGGLIPVLPFFLLLPHSKIAAYLCVALTAVILGTVRSRFNDDQSAVASAAQFLAVVTAGALAGVGVGALLQLIPA